MYKIKCPRIYWKHQIYKLIYGCKECFHSKIECLQFLEYKKLIKSKKSLLLDTFKEINDCIRNCKYGFYTKKCDYYNCEEFQKFIKENQLEEYINEQIEFE